MFATPLSDGERHLGLVAAARRNFAILQPCVARLHPDAASDVRQCDALVIWSMLHGLASMYQSGALQTMPLGPAVVGGMAEHVDARIRAAFAMPAPRPGTGSASRARWRWTRWMPAWLRSGYGGWPPRPALCAYRAIFSGFAEAWPVREVVMYRIDDAGNTVFVEFTATAVFAQDYDGVAATHQPDGGSRHTAF